MKKTALITAAALAAMMLSACAQTNTAVQSAAASAPASEAVQSAASSVSSEPAEGASETAEGGSSILIAYFTRLDNTDATLDEVLAGGGPYGAIGTDLDSASPDAIASASITVVDGEAQGNVETLAKMIQANTDGDLFSIQTEKSYPINYDELIDEGNAEKSANERPAIANSIENFDSYDVIFIGFPNWWYDMPMAMYSFLDGYDFTGKTVVPFASSAGSGFSNAINTLTELLPTANVVQNGLHVQMTQVADAQSTVDEWVASLNLDA